MSDIEKKLQSIGLSEQEARVFAAITHSSHTSVSDLARISGVKRTSVYEYLDDLLAHGLIRKVVVGKRIHYEASPPQALVRFARQREKSAQEQVRHAEDITTELESLMTNGNGRPHVRVYEGKGGIAEAYKLMLDTWQNVYCVFTPKHFFNPFSTTENHEFLMILKQRELHLFNLVERSIAADKRLAMRDYDSFVKSKLLPAGVSFSSDIIASVERLALISFPALTATVIDDPVVANVQRTLMKALWTKL